MIIETNIEELAAKIERGEVLLSVEKTFVAFVLRDWGRQKERRSAGGKTSKPRARIDTPEAAANREYVRRHRAKKQK